MSAFITNDITALLQSSGYVGRGIIIGKSADGKNAVCAYFIMGRSANSRNRVFTERDGVLYTEPFDAARVEDPRLILYAAVRKWQNRLILTNGDQTDTIYEGLQSGKTFAEALAKRSFEPDAPNFTPRISGLVTFSEGDFSYEMSILKSADAAGSACSRFTFAYPALPGTGHFIHTYIKNGNPLPSFCGEPERIRICDAIDEFTASVWDALDRENRISLFVRYTSLDTLKEETRIINRNRKGE